MSLIPCLVAMPLLAGLACLLLHRCAAICRVIAVAALAAACAASWLLFSRGSVSGEWHGVAFNADGLARLVCLGIGFFSLLVGLYSCAHKATRALGGAYFGFLLLAEGSAIAAALAGNLLLLLCAWGFMGLPLYALIASSGSDTAASTAKKAMIIVGGSDVFLVLGVAILLTLPSGGGPIPLSHGAA
ncbi:MAG: proton-conducting transporter membrane subunit, partial [Candidatus Aureabacteria bacterium]|nr:proton-conducting transporter membrane subunit [Candidatus Auribacterota bacterium]